ncbi:MAG: 8-oxo-dGTP diphosphatase MutT [Verrucomicrobia bacterium]|nr:8-oxo-dGTP diphosphatase MutT [Verrucomicrobiota bacterium]
MTEIRISKPGPYPDDRRIVEVAAGLVFRKGRLLITRRRPEDHLGGYWEFPGGKREPNETSEACLQRELSEELGIVVRVDELLGCVTHRYPEKTVRLEFYRCTWRRHKPRALGCQDFAWVTQREVGSYVFPPADRKLLRRLRVTDHFWR